MRLARTQDISALQRIETAAGEIFRTLRMDLVADDEPPSTDELRRYVDSDRAWVAVRDDEPVGYLTYELVDGEWHIEQVSVDPEHAGRGLGRQLIERVADIAAAAGVAPSPSPPTATFPGTPRTTNASGSVSFPSRRGRWNFARSGSGRRSAAWTSGLGSVCGGSLGRWS